MSSIDWAAVLQHVTARNVAKWVLVVSFAVFAVIALSWFATYAWTHS